jgi:hypothetical protein
MVELYLNEVFDLLAEPLPDDHGKDDAKRNMTMGTGNAKPATNKLQRCELRQAGSAMIVGSTEVAVESLADAMQWIEFGFAQRTTHDTLTNDHSSRSHLLLTVTVAARQSDGSYTTSRLLFVDLAGSERVHRSLSSGDRLKEAQHINKSLSALGDVMAALSSTPPAAHVPYRNSKLTQLLQQCIGGTSRTLMLTCLCPHVPQRHNLGESAATLQFASRTKLVRNQRRLQDERPRRPANTGASRAPVTLHRTPVNH